MVQNAGNTALMGTWLGPYKKGVKSQKMQLTVSLNDIFRKTAKGVK
jgi:hypothetical protein